MIQEDENLLLKDLCARLPYGIKVRVTKVPIGLSKDETLTYNRMYSLDESNEYITIKPYLRSMSSMTEEEREEYHSLCFDDELEVFEYGEWSTKVYYHDTIYSIDWLNAHHFDYRGLIEKGLAIEVTKDNNPYNN